MFFFRTEGGMTYVALEPDETGFISMGTFDNLGTEDQPVYYFDRGYIDHMIAIVDPIYDWKKHTAAQAKKKARSMGIRDPVDLYSFENTHWFIKKI